MPLGVAEKPIEGVLQVIFALICLLLNKHIYINWDFFIIRIELFNMVKNIISEINIKKWISQSIDDKVKGLLMQQLLTFANFPFRLRRNRK